MKKNLLLILASVIILQACQTDKSAQVNEPTTSNNQSIEIIGYYMGNAEQIKAYPTDKLTQIIFSFMHLKGNQLTIDDEQDSLALMALTALKKDNPNLKILVSLGGWGGCETCSDVFTSAENISAFAQSVKKIMTDYNADGIDLDWEYPTIPGHPGHKYAPEDKTNFTALAKELREVLGPGAELSFAAGGFTQFLEESVDWKACMPYFDRVNLMSYDLINGNSTETGHHTALYSNPNQKESTHNAIQYLDSIGIPKEKIIIGAAIYARIWENVGPDNRGLYQSGNFKRSVSYKMFDELLSPTNGFVMHWDSITKAPYAYHPELKQFATFDDSTSIGIKTKYVQDQGLGGIMFWQLLNDKPKNGLLDVIYETSQK